MPSRSILVGVYQNSLEAGLGQAILEEEGIPSEIENLTSQSWLMGELPATGFRLMVASPDAERAKQVLDRGSAAPATAAADEEPHEEPEAPAVTGREELGPTAALLLGIFIWGPFTLGLACVWAVTLLRSQAARSLSWRARVLLIGGTVLALTQIALLLVTGWPRESVSWWWGESQWGWIAVDGAFALAVALGYVSASRRWPAR